MGTKARHGPCNIAMHNKNIFSFSHHFRRASGVGMRGEYVEGKQHEGFLHWAEGSVRTQKEGTWSPEINRWNGDLP